MALFCIHVLQWREDIEIALEMEEISSLWPSAMCIRLWLFLENINYLCFCNVLTCGWHSSSSISQQRNRSTSHSSGIVMTAYTHVESDDELDDELS